MPEQITKSQLKEMIVKEVKKVLNEGNVIDRIEKTFGITLKVGRNIISGYPFDVDDEPLENGLMIRPVDRDAVTGLYNVFVKKGFKTKAKGKYLNIIK